MVVVEEQNESACIRLVDNAESEMADVLMCYTEIVSDRFQVCTTIPRGKDYLILGKQIRG